MFYFWIVLKTDFFNSRYRGLIVELFRQMCIISLLAQKQFGNNTCDSTFDRKKRTHRHHLLFSHNFKHTTSLIKSVKQSEETEK